MVTENEKRLVQQSWVLVEPIEQSVGDLFYQRLFEQNPEYRGLFPEDLEKQKRKLVAMLRFVVAALRWPIEEWKEEIPETEDLLLVLLALGRRHSALYRVPDESYEAVGEALLWTLAQGLGRAFDSELRAAWEGIYEVLAKTMKVGAHDASDSQLGDEGPYDHDPEVEKWMEEL